MSPDTRPPVAPIGLQAEQGEVLWFLGFLVFVKASSETTDGRVAVIEHLGPRGAGSPLHVHSREDEWFYVTEGELTFWVGGEVIQGPAGSFVYGPRGIPFGSRIGDSQVHPFAGKLEGDFTPQSGPPTGNQRGFASQIHILVPFVFDKIC